MGAPDVLARLSALGVRLTREGGLIRAVPRSALTDEARALIREHKPELLQALATEALPDPAAEARGQRVAAMLAENPTARYAVLTDTQADPGAVLLTLAIRGRATCELRVPRDKYDPFLLLTLIEHHGGTVH